MDGTTATARRNPLLITGLTLVCVAVGLLGYAVGGWLGPAATSSTLATTLPGGQTSAALGVPLTAAVVLLAAVTLVLRARRPALPAGMRDPLTGLYAGRYLAEVLPGLMARDDRSGTSQLALVRVRIDRIDEVRRIYGGLAVERVVQSVGRHIRSQTREGDFPSQPDDQGFAVFLHCGEIEQARAFCRRLNTVLRNEQLDWQGDVIKVSPRMAAVVREIGESVADLDQRVLRQLDAGAGQAVD